MANIKIRRNRRVREQNASGNSDNQGNVAIESSITDSGDGGADSEPINAADGDSGESGGDKRGEFIDPAGIGGSGSDSADNQPRRKRGRPAGSGGKSSTKKEKAGDLDALIYHAHLALTAISGIPELELDEDESKKLGAAAQRVVALYSDFEYPEKVMAWMHLALTAGGVYGPRYLAASIRIKREKSAEKKPQHLQPATVTAPITFPTGMAHA